ncbi:hypothetical protein NTD84_29545 [Pseudomonas sp. 14P_8.1_Bac3]|uniref:hypothetical protein n=1 Tax=Pseudomonas sp. 14P_8.1_Bac3 TaxID=2971621 RepID=UPI0021CAAD16|nr:hypothetical protein [Pseudomonas sp. 14P_8.1_Bac3]MCU1763845.1 hypothetical protein [Pseudomonas sp. 14P_8.1_Bac3]
MRLVNEFELTDQERQHTWPREEALVLVRQALQDREPIEGLVQLRAGLLIDIDSEVLDLIERGEWRLIKPDADYAEWIMPNRAFDPKVMALMRNPPVQPSRSPTLFRLLNSATGEPLTHRNYTAAVDGVTAPRRTDGAGIAHLFLSPGVQRISMVIIGG